jgi:hypothetical protein
VPLYYVKTDLHLTAPPLSIVVIEQGIRDLDGEVNDSSLSVSDVGGGKAVEAPENESQAKDLAEPVSGRHEMELAGVTGLEPT